MGAILSGCSSNSVKKTDWKLFNLNGKVKSCKETSYYAFQEHGKATKGERGGKEPYSNTCTLFNDKGYRTEVFSYKHDGTLFVKYTYVRSNNALSEIIQAYELESRTERLVFELNEKGLASKINVYNEDGSIEYTQTYSYDDYNNTSEQHINYPNSHMDKTILYKYEDNRLIDFTFLSYDGELAYKATYKYDDNNNVSEYCHYSADNTLKSKYIYTYDLDSNGNWITRYEYEDNVLRYITEREIEYFD